MEVLLEKQYEYIHKANTFLFATSGITDSHIRGSDGMSKFVSDGGTLKPDLLTSIKLRKHVASVAQVLSLHENEMDMLANFLGHDLRVHTEFYRMPLDVLQVARVSKVFMAAESGNIGQCAGKGLSDIDIEVDEHIELHGDHASDEDSGSDTVGCVGIL